MALHPEFPAQPFDPFGIERLVASTTGLADSLDLHMVVEGTESTAAYDELVRLGCDQARGYHMSRPVPAAELNIWLNARGAIDGLTDSHPHWCPPRPSAEDRQATEVSGFPEQMSARLSD